MLKLFFLSDASEVRSGFDLTITVFSRSSTASLAFDAGEGSGTMHTIRDVLGSTVTIPECGFTSPVNCRFASYTDGETTYHPNEEITLNEDKTLTALYAEQVTIIYVFGDKARSVTALVGTTIELRTFDSLFTLPDRQIFKGWQLGDALYQGGDSFTVPGETTFTAVLEDAPLIGHSDEYVCLHRALAYRLLTRDRFVLHGAAIQIDGRACLFTAKSGVGKSTHIRLWREVFGARVRIVNGDKPILWKRDGRWLVCGTPWCGKEGWTSTDCVPAAGLCLLERAPENEIHPASEEELADHIFHQIPHPAQPALFVRELELLGDFLAATPCWQLRCTPTPEAARLAAKTMLAESMELEPEAFETASAQQ